MKTLTLKILTLSAVLLMFAGNFVSCKEKEEYPKEIPFTEYSLENTSCQWKNLEYGSSKPGNGKVLMINSDEELENYIECTEGSYPEIDFSKQTLIIAWGVAYNGIHNIEKQLMQTGNYQYNLDVTIELDGREWEEKWTVSIVTDKLSNNVTVVLSDKFIENF